VHKLALKLGLTVLLQDFVVSNLLGWLPISIGSMYVYMIGGLIISFVLALLTAPRVESPEPPPGWASVVLVAAA
jgi:hypothetical protein